jgi:hypothetical protein
VISILLGHVFEHHVCDVVSAGYRNIIFSPSLTDEVVKSQQRAAELCYTFSKDSTLYQLSGFTFVTLHDNPNWRAHASVDELERQKLRGHDCSRLEIVTEMLACCVRSSEIEGLGSRFSSRVFAWRFELGVCRLS